MKNLLLALLLFVSVAASAQITITSNPTLVSPGTTSTTEVRLRRGDFDEGVPNPVLVVIRFASTNVGTIQVNTYNDTMTSSPAFAATDGDILITVSKDFWIKCSNANDDFIIFW